MNVIVQNMEEVKREQMKFHNNHYRSFLLTRTCSGCFRQISQADILLIGESSLGIWYNCIHCGSTMVQKHKHKHEIEEKVSTK